MAYVYVFTMIDDNVLGIKKFVRKEIKNKGGRECFRKRVYQARYFKKSPTSVFQESKWIDVIYKSISEFIIQVIPFSTFWLRSSVVSVLINLISDMWPNGSHDIKLLFWGGEIISIACYWISQVSPMYCTIAWAGTPYQLVQFFFSS